MRNHPALVEQHGMLTRGQLLEWGANDADIRRWLHRRDLVRVLPGVYADHTGPLSWKQRCLAGVLAYPATALDKADAVRWALGGTALAAQSERDADEGAISLASASHRRLPIGPGYTLTRLTTFSEAVTDTTPQRLRLEPATLRWAASARSEAEAVSLLTEVVRSRRTTAARLQAWLPRSGRLRHGALIAEVLTDIDLGTNSVAEREFVKLVQRPHGLPVPRQQTRAKSAGITRYHDFEFDEFGLTVEVDGYAHHGSRSARDRDLARDLQIKLSGADVVRVGYRQVTVGACDTAASLGYLLARRGWTGRLRACSAGCAAVAGILPV
ncbi:MAG: hypothetical protein WAW88_06010 [Nocardioides sp.]